jgi:hypothetical protein
MCGAPRKGPSTWCSKLGRKKPASDASGCSCRGHPLVPIPAPAEPIRGPSNRDLVLPREPRLRGRRHGHLREIPHMALKTFPDAKLLSIHAVRACRRCRTISLIRFGWHYRLTCSPSCPRLRESLFRLCPSVGRAANLVGVSPLRLECDGFIDIIANYFTNA